MKLVILSENLSFSKFIVKKYKQGRFYFTTYRKHTTVALYV